MVVLGFHIPPTVKVKSSLENLGIMIPGLQGENLGIMTPGLQGENLVIMIPGLQGENLGIMTWFTR